MPQIDTSQFTSPGLYLLWPDGSRLDLTQAAIEGQVRAMLDDPRRIPPHVKAAADYQPCEICPQRHTAEICHSIMTALPFMDEIDRYMSYDQVTALYREAGSGVLYVIDTTMQEALKYVSILGLTQYCEVGKQYGGYFAGIDPLTPPPLIAAAIFRNIFLDARGDLHRVAALIETMQEQLLQTTRCQVARLQLISKRDAFLNAFVATNTTVQCLLMELRRRLHEELAAAPVPKQSE